MSFVQNNSSKRSVWLGRKHTEVSKIKMSESHKGIPIWNKGIPMAESVKLRLSESCKGFPAWNKGVPCREEVKRKISIANKGMIPWNKNKKMTKEYCETLSKVHKLNPIVRTQEYKDRISQKLKGRKPWNKGIPCSEEVKKKLSIALKDRVFSTEVCKKISQAKKGKLCGELSSAWQGGISFEPYNAGFNIVIKNKVKSRDRYTCSVCYLSKDQIKYPLSVHHIDYDKKNNVLHNLISLCRSCHTATNHNRDYWKEQLQKKMFV